MSFKCCRKSGLIILGLHLLAAFLVSVRPVEAAPTWHQVNGPGFTLLTSDSAEEAEDIARDYRQFIRALAQLIPIELAQVTPLTITIMRSPRAFRPYRPLDPQGKPKDVAGYFTRDPSWALAVIAGEWKGDAIRHIIQHEGVHLLLENTNVRRELWLEEGLAEVFATAKKTKDGFIIGYPIAHHVHFLRDYTTMSLGRLLAVNHKDPEYNERSRTGRFYATSWFLVHYVLFGEHEIPRTAINTYLNAVRSMERPAAFKHAFGLDYDEMQKRLKVYLRGGNFIQKILPDISDGTPLPATPASPLAVEITLARIAIKVDNYSRAEQHISRVRELAPESAVSDELDGYLNRERRDYPEAAVAFARAAAKGSSDFGVYYWPAMFRISKPEPMATPPDKLGTLPSLGSLMPNLEAPHSVDDPRWVANQFKRAINLQPRWLRSYTGLAAVIPQLPSLQKSDYDFLTKGVSLYPEELAISIGMAIYEYRDGQTERARQRISVVARAAEFQSDAKIQRKVALISEDWDYDEARNQVIKAINEKRLPEARAAWEQLSAQNVRVERRTDLNHLFRVIERAESVGSPTK